ncbi:MAG: aminoglycoside phosphotransferase [Chloroflexi bacterium]|nr:aminoglycoside phosphotransferase [Chloroflexota bacterium]
MPITIPMHTVARILGRHGLGRVSVEALPGGQINASYLVDEQYVLRVNLRPEEHGKLARERRVLEMLRDLMPVPHTIAYEGSSRLIPHEYMIQTFVPGESLLVRWGKADEAERASYLSQLATMLRRLHSVRLSGFGDPTNPRQGETWAALHARRAGHALQSARTAANVDPSLIDQVEQAIVHDSAALVGGYPSLTHGDLHFGNIHVDQGKVTGLLDFERAWAATPDWDLDQLVRFVNYPSIFASSAAEQSVGPVDLAEVIPALQSGYPDLFAVNSLQSRLRVYALEYELRALVSVRKRHNNNPDALRAVEARIRTTLSPEFPGF